MQQIPHSEHQEEEIQEIPDEIDHEQQYQVYHETPPFHSNIHKRTLNSKRNSNLQFMNKTQQYLINKRQKITHLKAQLQEKTKADCTFKPSINRSKSKSSRNLKEFLDFQANHTVKIDEKKEILKKRLENEQKTDMTFSPKINKKKNYKNKENVHERLYKLKDNNNKDFLFDDFNHIPKITAKGERLTRNLPVEELLYQDAKRRQQKQTAQALQAEKNDKEILPKNTNGSKYAAQKFLKDFNHTLASLKLQNHLQFSEKQFVEILKHLGFTRYMEQQNNPLALQEKSIVKEAHEYLSQFKLTQSSLYVFLLAVGGIYDIEVGDGTVVQESQGKKIHQYFDLLYRSRLFNDHARKSIKNVPKDVNSFKPMINPDTSGLADKYRCKMVEKANQIFAKNDINMQLPDKGLTHGDLLVIYNLSQTLEKQKLRENKLLQKDPQCTFQPNHEKYQDYVPQHMGKQKCQELYEQAKAKQIECNRLNSTITTHNQDKSLSKRSNLSPKASNVSRNTPTNSKSNMKSYLQVKDIDKVMARMVLGRQLRNEKRQYEERGQPIITRKPAKRVPEVQPQRQLLLDVDVSINNVYKKILIFSDQKDCVSELVREFSRRQGLDIDSCRMLEQQLKDAIMNLQLKQSNNFFSN